MSSRMKMNYKVFLLTLILVLVSTSVFAFPSVSKMFKMNKQLQEEGYYMAEFEFKMLGIVYNLDHWHFIKAYSQLTRLNKQLKTREDLIKLPDFKNKEEELEFYLNLQNPKTGAFMDDSYPFCTYPGPTGNVLIHLESLAKETGKPLKLKYPLYFLDKINTPETLVAYLDNVAHISSIGNKFPQTSFHFTRCLLSLFYEDNTVESNHLYTMSPEWHDALLKWFYDHQDPETGLWGPMNKKGKLMRRDTMNTASILKSFIDSEGRDKHKKYPLQYREQLANSFLDVYSFELPDDDAFDDWHEWNLNTSKSVRMMYRTFWKDLTDQSKERTKILTNHYIKVKFEKFFVEKDGAFNHYPNSSAATLDGSGGIVTAFKEIGAFSAKRFTDVWGVQSSILSMKNMEVETMLTEKDIQNLMPLQRCNSVRIYSVSPDSNNYCQNVQAVFYPQVTKQLDVMDLIPRMKNWVDTTSQSLGNWASKEDLSASLNDTGVSYVTVYQANIPINEINTLLKNQQSITLIGFDQMQYPQSMVTINYKR